MANRHYFQFYHENKIIYKYSQNHKKRTGLKTNKPIYCINIPESKVFTLDTHLTEYTWRAFYMLYKNLAVYASPGELL